MKSLSLKKTLLLILAITTISNLFAQSEDENRMQIRLGFTSVNDIHRQLLVTVDENTTVGIDYGYDAELFENNPDDMYWVIDNRLFTIQGINTIDITTVLPLGLHISADGVNTIQIDQLNNVPEDLEIVIFDNETSSYHNIKNGNNFSIELTAGTYLGRFELRFVDESNTDNENDTDANDNGEDNSNTDTDNEDNSSDVIEELVEIEDTTNKVIKFRFINSTKRIAIDNPKEEAIQSVDIYSINGQLKEKYTLDNNKNQVIQTNNLNSGNYIIVIATATERISKKIAVN